MSSNFGNFPLLHFIPLSENVGINDNRQGYEYTSFLKMSDAIHNLRSLNI